MGPRVKWGASLEGLLPRALDVREPQRALEGLLATVTELTDRLGLRVVELPLDALFIYPSLFSNKAMLQIRRAAQERSMEFTIHLPYWWLDLSSLNEVMRGASVHSMTMALERARILEPLAYVLHPLGERAAAVASSDWSKEEKRFYLIRMMERARRSLEELAAASPPGRLCIENVAGLSTRDVFNLALERGLPLCLDTGHLALSGDDLLTFTQNFLADTRLVHLHDVVPIPSPEGVSTLRDHQPVGSGVLPLREMLDLAQRWSWDGVVVLEMTSREDLARSVGTLQGWGFLAS